MAAVRQSPTIQATFYRGGTSNALMIHKADLPASQSDWEPILAGAIGSPDPYGRQLNGMGGGASSLSKVCVISKSDREDADVDYTFVQMRILDGKMDLEDTCGNMTAAVGPFAVDEGIFTPVLGQEDDEQVATVRIFNTNTRKIIHSKFLVEGSKPTFKSTGSYSIDGVPGTGSRITLSFLSPGGSKTGRILPTGNAVDTMCMDHSIIAVHKCPSKLRVSLIDAGNPAVIIVASDLGIQADIQPNDLDCDQILMELLETIRKQGASVMGLDPSVDSIPKMVLISAASSAYGDVDLLARVLSMRQTHKAIPLTIALNLGVASQLEGTLPYLLAAKHPSQGRVVVGHPSGRVEVGAHVRQGNIECAVLHRTARPLMRGEVYWR